ncbi:MAG TPA: protein kinase, partial [Thermoanaerobaculia bacterium]|nr:protein kinase [Thermoanaerobaculia bacterium]
MALSPGTRLGPYEIVEPIGAGGMGEVYRARDTRLNRSVAVKILPAEFAQNVQLRLRFEREAKTISQLSHPNICTLYDVGDNYLVMELLDGETLADRLARGALPLAEALRVAIQIADALDKAHRQSIIHRDLKPGNIMLTRGGAKLLDFGLARVGNVVLTGAPVDATQQKPITQEGTIVGTFNYMAPEQLEGEEADERTDLFAFGAVLYEMVTGRRAFTGSTRTSLIAAIVSGEPRLLSELQPVAPPSVDKLVARCLAKDPDTRWQCAADLKWELHRIEDEVNHPAAAARRKRSYVAAAIAAAIALLFAALFVAERARRPRPEPPIRFTVSPPSGWIFPVGNNIGPPAFAPDGRKFAVAGIDLSSGKSMLWIRDLAEAEPKLLAGTEGAGFPFWSPDSNALGFFAGGRLNRIDVNGGSLQTLCDVSFPRGGTWSSNGEIIFCPLPSNSLFAVSANGGVPRPLTTLDAKQKETSHRWPSMLPDGRHYLFLVRRPNIGDAIYVGSIDSREKKLLTAASSNAMYVEPGYVLFVRNRTLYARRFDLKTLSFTAAEFPIAHAIQSHGSGFALFSAARNVLVYEGGTLASSLEVIGRDSRLQGTLGEASDYFSVNITSDGQHVVYSLLDPVTGTSDIWLYDRRRRVARRQTFDPASDFYG